MNNPLLIFDLGNVIIRHDNDHWLQQLTGACADPAKARVVIQHYLKNAAADVGEGTVESFFDRARDDLGFTGSYDAFARLWCCHFSHDVAMEGLVADLAEKYRVVILSNTDDAHWRHLMREYPIMTKVHARYTSFELRLRKPDAAIYQHVLDAEGYQPANAVFIDDRIENVQAAQALGIQGIHFTDLSALQIDLAAEGIAP